MKALFVEVVDHMGDQIKSYWFPENAYIDARAPGDTISIRCAREDQIEDEPFWVVIDKAARIIHFEIAEMDQGEE